MKELAQKHELKVSKYSRRHEYYGAEIRALDVKGSSPYGCETNLPLNTMPVYQDHKAMVVNWVSGRINQLERDIKYD